MLPRQLRFKTFSLSERLTERSRVSSFSMCARHFNVDHSAGKTWSDLTGTSIFCVTLMDAQLTLNITSISGNKAVSHRMLLSTIPGSGEWCDGRVWIWNGLWMERGPVKASFNVWWMVGWRDGVHQGMMAFFIYGLNGGVLALRD